METSFSTRLAQINRSAVRDLIPYLFADLPPCDRTPFSPSPSLSFPKQKFIFAEKNNIKYLFCDPDHGQGFNSTKPDPYPYGTASWTRNQIDLFLNCDLKKSVLPRKSLQQQLMNVLQDCKKKDTNEKIRNFAHYSVTFFYGYMRMVKYSI